MSKIAIFQALRQLKNDGRGGGSARKISQIVGMGEKLVGVLLLSYNKYGYVSRTLPVVRGKRPRGRQRYFYWITDRGLEMLVKYEALIAHGFPPQPRKYSVPEGA